MKKYVQALLLALALLCVCWVACAEGAPEDGFAPVSQDGYLTLYANPETGEVLVEDGRDGYLWRSNPAEPDKRAKGVHKTSLQSQLLIGFTNERGTALTAISQVDSFKRGGMSMEIRDGEVVTTYDFPKQEIRLKLHYMLHNGALEVSVPVDEVENYGLNTLTSVELLPAFGAAGEDETGYLLVPDGSGAIIRFNNGVSSMNEYKAAVYGKDPSVNGQISLSNATPTARTYEQTVRMPVFGVNRGNHGLLGIITENDSKAVIHAKVSNLSSYNSVWSEFQLRNSGTIIMNKKEFEQSLTGISERDGLTTGRYTVRYYFLSGEAESSYAGMAKTYREYLVAEKGLTQRTTADTYPLYLDLYGYVDKNAQFLGIPYIKAVPLTTVKQVGEIVEAVGVPQTVVRYRQFLDGSAYGKIPYRASVCGALGSAEELRALAQSGVQVYPDADLVNVYRKGRGFRPLYDAVLTPVNSPQMQFMPNWGTTGNDPKFAPWYLLSPQKYDFFYNRMLDQLSGLQTGGISLSALGDVLTADNRTDGIGRQDAQTEVCAVLQSARNKMGSVMIDGGNAYAAALADHVLEAPANSSMYNITNEAVPFWQMVFHGYVYYSLTPGNETSDLNRLTLQCLESGASPLYAWTGQNQDKLLDSRMLDLFSSDYQAWTADAAAQYGELQQVLAQVSCQPITGHEILSEHVRRTDYGSLSVYVNYGNEDAVVQGVKIPAGGYVVKEVSAP